MTAKELAKKLSVPEDWFAAEPPVLTGRTFPAGFAVEAIEYIWPWDDPFADMYGGGAVMLDRSGTFWIADIEEHGSRLRGLLTHSLTIRGPLDADALFMVPPKDQDVRWLEIGLARGVKFPPPYVRRVWEHLGCRWYGPETNVVAPAGFSFEKLRTILWKWRLWELAEPRFGALVREEAGWVWYLSGTSTRIDVAGPSDTRRAFEGLVPDVDIAHDESGFDAAKRAAND